MALDTIVNVSGGLKAYKHVDGATSPTRALIDTGGDQINPATNETLASLLGAVGTVEDFFSITPDDATPFAEVRAIYVGGAGDVVAKNSGGTSVTFANVQAGSVLPIKTTVVLDTGTTATGLVGLV